MLTPETPEERSAAAAAFVRDSIVSMVGGLNAGGGRWAVERMYPDGAGWCAVITLGGPYGSYERVLVQIGGLVGMSPETPLPWLPDGGRDSTRVMPTVPAPRDNLHRS